MRCKSCPADSAGIAQFTVLQHSVVSVHGADEWRSALRQNDITQVLIQLAVIDRDVYIRYQYHVSIER
jgi:hypothetical protein